ncbi:CotH kinase family protein [Tuberibacillus sp. Marseille-P3662]|uniref:CotH kinase family protein n=1 Tax=Tuberibacillus sp. Marseille-P3662 TaxID=1965358 RepID=UPI000A1CECF1|nr:CotH kinase family protein [Tuberibacillus sp. Marseille-P3662]
MGIQKEVPTYDISISPSDLKKLRSDIWSDQMVQASLSFDNVIYDAEIGYRGAHIRKFPKKSFQCHFDEKRTIHLNAEYVDATLLRNKLSLDFFSSIGVLSPSTHYVNLVINEAYQGIYLQIESVDKHFLESRGRSYGPIWYAEDDDANFSLMSPIDYDVKQSFDDGYSRKEGHEKDDIFLKELIYKINTMSRSEFEKNIERYINIDKYLRWLSGVVCTQNFDGFIHNYALYRDTESGLFELIPWDFDATWGRDINGEELDYDYIPIKGYNTLTARVLDVPAFRKHYGRLLKNILNDQFTTEFLNPQIKGIHGMLRPYVLQDPYIKTFINAYDEEPQFIMNFIKSRNKYLRSQLSKLT